MKKILFLLLVCFIKLNAYEYLIYDNPNAASGVVRYVYYFEDDGSLNIRRISGSGIASEDNYDFLKNNLYQIRINGTYYIKNYEFQSYLKNDLELLNSFYITNDITLQGILNYFYNDNRFSSTDYIRYNNYELLYNSDGLVVESIVNGKWAGLYDDSGQSGNLFNEKGDLVYVNGVPASFFDRINEKLLRKFKINLESIFIKKIFYPLLVLIFACVILRSVIRMAFQAFLIRFYDKKISQLEKRREKIENA